MEPIENKDVGSKVIPFRYKDLKIYGSAEWLAGRKKKYRRAFDRAEATYVYAELSLYNKNFDIKDWDIEVNLKAFALKGNRRIELCTLDVERHISKEENIIYIREGWGNKKAGIYWKKGTYLWEATINDQVVGSTKFYIEDVGLTRPDYNPYFSIESIKLYESGDDGVLAKDRIFYKKFKSKDARFIFIEFNFKNLVEDPWNCELHFNFYNDARQLKGETIELKHIGSEDRFYTITTGWGSDTRGTWFPDNYTLEVIFMDQLIAVLPYEVVTTEYEEGINEAYIPHSGSSLIKKTIVEDNQSLEEVLAELDKLIGLQSIKVKIKEYSEYLKFIKLRIDKGFDDSSQVQMHAVFTGNPGTGKTTVAKKLGKIYQKMGLLSKGHVHEVDRSDLVGEYIGQTAPKVKEAIKQAKGGVLFIDEAYSLARSSDDTKDFGREVLEILVKEMSDGTGDIAVVFAGYPAEMQTFLDANAGLKSRINLRFDFPDYMPQELADIAEYAAAEHNVMLTKQAKAYIYDKIVKAYRNRDRFFGNARMIHQLIEKGKINLGLRIMQNVEKSTSHLTEEDLSIIQVEDVERIYKEEKKKRPDIPVDEESLEAALDELDKMIGLDEVKKEIHEMVRLVRYYQESSKEVLNSFSLHSVFIGNPGTGKTTVARIVAQIYRSLGILERGHKVEVDRGSLVAGFVGQTAIKTKRKIDEAIGGILFIDEAYALNQKGGNDFGGEAVETLLKRMEDSAGEFAVIAAGYPEPMKKFVESNPGLKSRFDRTIEFKDFTTEQLLEIALFLFDKEKFVVTEDAKEYLAKYIQMLVSSKDKYFGNGRVMRNTVKEAIKQQNLRLSQILFKDRTDDMKNTITLEDMHIFDEVKAWNIGDKGRVGFRRGM